MLKVVDLTEITLTEEEFDSVFDKLNEAMDAGNTHFDHDEVRPSAMFMAEASKDARNRMKELWQEKSGDVKEKTGDTG